MSKKISVKKDGTPTVYTGIRKVRTGILAKSDKVDWIPKDEAKNSVPSINLNLDEPGTYRIAKGGETAGIYKDDEPFYIADVKAIASVSVNISPNFVAKTITENGLYDAKEEGADGFYSIRTNVQPKKGDVTLHRNGEFRASDYGLDAFSSVKISVDNPYPATRYAVKSITKNGTYTASSENHWGYSDLFVSIPMQPVTKGWELWSNTQLYGDTEDVPIDFENLASAVIGRNIYMLSTVEGRASRMMKFNTNTQMFERLSTAPPRRFSVKSKNPPYMINDGGTLLIFGGYDYTIGDSSIREVWRYTPSTDSYEKVEKMTLPEISQGYVRGVTFYKGELHIMFNNNIYRWRTGKWQKPSTSTFYSPRGIVEWNDKIAIIRDAGIGVWDPFNGSKNLSALPFSLIRPRFVVHNNRIRVLSSATGSHTHCKMADFSADGSSIYQASFLIPMGESSPPFFSDFICAETVYNNGQEEVWILCTRYLEEYGYTYFCAYKLKEEEVW